MLFLGYKGNDGDLYGLYIELGASCTFCINADLDYLDVAVAGKLAPGDRNYSADRHFLCHG